MFKKPGTCSRAFLLRGVIVTSFCELCGDDRVVSHVGKSRSNGFSVTGFQVGAERQRTRVRSSIRTSGQSGRRLSRVGFRGRFPFARVRSAGRAITTEDLTLRRRWMTRWSRCERSLASGVRCRLVEYQIAETFAGRPPDRRSDRGRHRNDLTSSDQIESGD